VQNNSTLTPIVEQESFSICFEDTKPSLIALRCGGQCGWQVVQWRLY
jgi:hypothetical protein